MILQEDKAATLDQAKYYHTLFNNYDGYIEVREIAPDNNINRKFMKLPQLMNYKTPKNRNVYAGIYERRYKGSGKINNCSKTNAIFLDFDDTTLETIRYTIDVKGVPLPSMVINSGGGFHVYWILEKSAGHELQPVIKKLAETLGADVKATDIARIMRIPDTNNLKRDPVNAELIELNSNVTDIEDMKEAIDFKPAPAEQKGNGVIKELADTKQNGLNNMARGVEKGSRNFSAGRIVQTLKRMNYTKQEIKDIVYRWNSLNKPQKDKTVLNNEINLFYHDDRYIYDGATFSDIRLQALNITFIDNESLFFVGQNADFHNYDNELLNPANFQKASGLTFAVLAVVKLAESDGIRREHIADLTKRHEQDNKLKESLKQLCKLQYITIVKKGQVNYYVYTEKSNYKRGYTAVSKSLHRSFIYGELKEPEYKLIILLESYAYDNKKEIYPSVITLALRLGQTDRTVRNNLKRLEHLQFIKRDIALGRTYIRFIYR